VTADESAFQLEMTILFATDQKLAVEDRNRLARAGAAENFQSRVHIAQFLGRTSRLQLAAARSVTATRQCRLAI